MTFTSDAVVIKVAKTGESDRLITLLTRDRGVVKAFAKAAARPKNKLHMSTNLFCYGSFTFFEGRQSLKVSECELYESFFSLREDITLLSLAQYFDELITESAPVEAPAEDFLRLFLNTLHILRLKKLDLKIVKSVFEMRLCMLSGYMPSLVGCAECGEFETEHMYFDIASGELYCQKHARPTAVRLPLETVSAMRHIVFSPFSPSMFAVSLSEDGLKLLSRVSESYTLSVIGKKLKSLEFYRSLGAQ